MVVKPKRFTILQMLDWKFFIALDPRQKWLCTSANGKYNISRDNVALNFSKEEFEKYFREVE